MTTSRPRGESTDHSAWPARRDYGEVVADEVHAARAERTGRVLVVTACVAAFAGTVLVVLWARAPESPVNAEQTAPSRAVVLPSTVPPIPTSPTTLAETTTTAPTTSADPSRTTVAVTTVRPAPTTVQPAPTTAGIADLLPPIDRGAAIPEQRDPRASPVAVENSVFDSTRYPIRSIGLEADGQLEIPDETEIGWYRYGATAGAPGATVLAAHVSWNGTTGPFFELGQMDPGARIAVALDDGTTREYEVIERAQYDKTELPRDRIWRTTGDETLVLITCGGDFNPEIRRYRSNIVVYAVPVG